jgi:Rps23 Pro-64 3,4-dihydroxylase Tpa1-like proline 4-hydroxylase
MISESAIQTMLGGYKTEDPYPHIVIDNFLKEESLGPVLESLRELQPGHSWSTFWNNPIDNCTYQKYAFNTGFNQTLKNLFTELSSDSFIDAIEKLTGITGIIRNETELAGAGVHKILNGGYLAMHTDFNSIDNPTHGKLERRLNLLIYMNPDWKEEYNGHLNIGYKHSVSPILNRCVIFNTTSKSWHGHPVALSVPDGMCRQSIAFYYYTKNVNGATDFEGRELSSGTTWRV